MPSDTRETDFEAEMCTGTQTSDVEEMDIVSARLWFEKNARFDPPPYEAPSASRSSSELQDGRIRLLKGTHPTVLFPDKDKAKRFIISLESALGDTKLKAGSVSPGITDDKEIEAIYKGLFSPQCEENKGLKRIVWQRMATEVDANALTRDALINAVADVTKRMLDKDITVRTEPMNPYQGDTTNQRPITSRSMLKSSKEHVDFIVTDETDRGAKDTGKIRKEFILYLIERKNPNVIEDLAKMLDKRNVHELDLYRNSSNQEKILNKVIYCMLFWDIPLLVVTSFTSTFILELHRTGSGCFVSYSPRIDADEGTTLFRVILGLTWVALKIANYEEFPVDAAFALYERSKGKKKRIARVTRSGCGCGSGAGSGAGSGSRSSKKGGSGAGRKTTEETSGKDASDGSKKAAASMNGTKHPLDVSSVDSTASGRTASKDPSGMVIRLEDAKEFTLGTGLHQVEVVRDARSPFPTLPTSDRVPCLTLLEVISSGSSATVYYSKLRAPLDGKVSNFVVKVIDFKERSHDEYRNVFRELLREYETYYLFGECKRDNKFSDIIESTTPTCYGLYKARRKRRDVFVLVLEDAGDVTLDYFRTWLPNEKSATLTSMICLHSLGLLHGDIAERNVAVKRDKTGQVGSVKLFDFDNSMWHECPGIGECSELEYAWDDLYPDGDAPLNPFDFQELTTRRYQLPFCNMQLHYAKMPEMVREVIVKRLKELTEVYDEEHFRAE